jgi:hypothetical protein
MSTSAPSLDQTDPSSTPMTPAPMMIILSGTLASFKAPVDETIVSSSMSTPETKERFLSYSIQIAGNFCHQKLQISNLFKTN